MLAGYFFYDCCFCCCCCGGGNDCRGTGAGVESMTFGYGPSAQPASYSEEVLSCSSAEDCLVPMGITSENVAKEYGITREVQDKFAARSFQKAAEAQKVRSPLHTSQVVSH